MRFALEKRQLFPHVRSVIDIYVCVCVTESKPLCGIESFRIIDHHQNPIEQNYSAQDRH
jgi:hypothetical protein